MVTNSPGQAFGKCRRMWQHGRDSNLGHDAARDSVVYEV
jgi:hypothetical protein